MVKWGASPGWSFGPNPAWGSIETTTIGKTHPTLLFNLLSFRNWLMEKMIFHNVRGSKNFLRNTISTSAVGIQNLLNIFTLDLHIIILRKKNKTVKKLMLGAMMQLLTENLLLIAITTSLGFVNACKFNACKLQCFLSKSFNVTLVTRAC